MSVAVAMGAGTSGVFVGTNLVATSESADGSREVEQAKTRLDASTVEVSSKTKDLTSQKLLARNLLKFKSFIIIRA